MLYFYLKSQLNIIFKIIILKTCPMCRFIKLIIRKLEGLLLKDCLKPEAIARFLQPVFYYAFLALVCLSLRLGFSRFFFILLSLIKTLFFGHLLALSLLFLIFEGLKEEKDHNKPFFTFQLTSCSSQTLHFHTLRHHMSSMSFKFVFIKALFSILIY